MIKICKYCQTEHEVYDENEELDECCDGVRIEQLENVIYELHRILRLYHPHYEDCSICGYELPHHHGLCPYLNHADLINEILEKQNG